MFSILIVLITIMVGFYFNSMKYRKRESWNDRKKAVKSKSFFTFYSLL
jgi:hypothetical protein